MHVSFSLFADAANLSQEGKLNILGVFDAVQAATLPSIHPRATLVIRIKASPSDAGSHALNLRWINPKGQELWSSGAELTISTQNGPQTELDMPIIVSIDLPLDLTGSYVMNVDLDGVQHSQVKLHVQGAATHAVRPSGMVS